MTNGYIVNVANQSSGNITVALASAGDTIDGVTNTTHVIHAKSCREYIVNTTARGYITKSTADRGMHLIQSQSASNSSSIDFTVGINSTYDEYVLVIAGLIPATDNTDVNLRVTEDAGANWQADATDYGWAFNARKAGTGDFSGDDASDSEILIAAGVGNATGESCSAKIIAFAPSSASLNKYFDISATHKDAAGAFITGKGSGVYLSNNAINGFRIIQSSGNITSGSFHLYGVRKV